MTDAEARIEELLDAYARDMRENFAPDPRERRERKQLVAFMLDLAAKLEAAEREHAWKVADLETTITNEHALYADAIAQLEKTQADLEAERYKTQRAEVALEDLASGAAHVQCLVARIGEMTSECRIDELCAACRARMRARATAEREP